VKKLASGTVTLYHYDYAGNLIAETDGNGTPLRDYVYLNGERIAMKVYGTQAGWYYFINDHLGTPHKIVDASGKVVWAAAYLPFGEAQIITETVENNFRFPGQYFDAETGLHYNWHRYYDPKTGRYLTPDPIGLEGGVNLYVYVGGNPVKRSDPYGLSWGEGIKNGLIGAGVGIIVGGAVVTTAPAWLAAGIGVAAAGAGGFMTGIDLYEFISGKSWTGDGQLTQDERETRGGQLIIAGITIAGGGSKWFRQGSGRDWGWLKMKPCKRMSDEWGHLTVSSEKYDIYKNLPPSERPIRLTDWDVTQYRETLPTGGTSAGRTAWGFILLGEVTP
jgi:RHS repeat-associated protein